MYFVSKYHENMMIVYVHRINHGGAHTPPIASEVIFLWISLISIFQRKRKILSLNTVHGSVKISHEFHRSIRPIMIPIEILPLSIKILIFV
jgi:hypothetical protein